MRILGQREAFAYRLAAFFDNDEGYARHIADVEKVLSGYNDRQRDSRAIYGTAQPGGGYSWTPERRRQQVQLVKDLYAKLSQGVGQNGQAMFMGGLGGSGKGHLLNQTPQALLNGQNYMSVNSDDIKEEMARRGMVPSEDGLSRLSPMERAGIIHEESSEMADQLAALAYRDRRNMIWDITMSSPESVQRRIDDLHKYGYGQIDGAFADLSPEEARRRVEKRHRGPEEEYREQQARGGPQPGEEPKYGGRYVASYASHLNKASPEGAQRGHTSKNSEVFDWALPQLSSSVRFDVRGNDPVVTHTTGQRWHNHPLSAGGSTVYPNVHEARRRAFRMAAEDTQQFSAEPTVRELMEQFERGQINFEDLMAGVATVGHFATNAGDWATKYERAERGPDNNAFFWVEQGELLEILSPEQVEQVAAALAQHIQATGRPGV